MTKQSSDPTNVLAPFDPATQEFLRFVDGSCRQASAEFKKHLDEMKVELGEELQIPPDVAMVMNMIRAYGILFNRCLDAGWIDGVLVEEDDSPKIVL